MLDKILNALGRLMVWVNGAGLAFSAAVMLATRGKGFWGGANYAMLCLFLVLFACGALLVRRTNASLREEAWRTTWNAALRHILNHQGRVYPLKMAADIRCDLEEAKAILDRLARDGHGEATLTDDFKTVYVFPLDDGRFSGGVPVTGTMQAPPVPVTGTRAGRPRSPGEQA